jgi:branched-chain amino acid transport system substrate-binding protein
MRIGVRSLSRSFAFTALAPAMAWASLAPVSAEDAVKIGLTVPMTGGQASTGRQLDNAVKLYMLQHGDTAAGKVVVILRDDGANPENTKRIAQELIVNDKSTL